MSEPTPMMRQYKRIKQEYKDAILFFRLGDFYEMFEQDAKEASSILNLTLTKRNNVPMCGIPYHAAKNYTSKLLKAGKKIAICEQIELPQAGKGIAKREVVEIITPGTVVDEDLLDSSSNNYLASLGKYKNIISFSYIDLSTGDFLATCFPWEERNEKLKQEFLRLNPKELLIQESLLEEDAVINRIIHEKQDLVINRFPDWSFDLDNSIAQLKRMFNVVNLKGFGIQENNYSVFSSGVLLEYLENASKNLLPHIKKIKCYSDKDYMGLDESSLKNLEIIRNMQDGTRRYTLIEVLDHTKTTMGTRKLKTWLLNPLNNKDQILERQIKVDLFYRNQVMLSSLREILGSILDLERLSARIAMDKAHAKDLLAVRNSIKSFLNAEQILSEWQNSDNIWTLDSDRIEEITGLKDLLEKSICEIPSILFTEGNLIKRGYNEELDSLREIKSDSKAILKKYLEDEKEKTGISSLKIKYNRIIGHYLEVTKSNVHLVPEHFIRRQSLVGNERYTTETLVEMETALNNASEKIINLEKLLFFQVRNMIKESVSTLLSVAKHISTIDCICSFAYAATINGYTKPKIINSKHLNIKEGRHPVVEANLPPGQFIPNSIDINSDSVSFALITGPNMAGKSTFLQQIALIVLMAQTGSFIPAQEATIGIVDNIFCRVGASDNLARGESTFLAEMSETANILRSATDRSLIIMDEVGRGTSTNDGLSIAWAVSEYLLNDIYAKTLFATHYHELTLIKHNKIENLSLEVLEKNGEVIFLKKVKKGAADNSYGIYVAQLAGLPESVTIRAKEIQKRIENIEKNKLIVSTEKNNTSNKQVMLFPSLEIIEKEISSLDINSITPLSAINKIAEWKKELNK